MGELADPIVSHLMQARVPAAPAAVWAALTCPVRSALFFHGMTVVSSWQAGATVHYSASGHESLTGEVLHADAPQGLSYTVEDTPGRTSAYVTWRLTCAEEGTVVTLTVDEVGTSCVAELAAVWAPVVDRLCGVVSRSGPAA